jgi:hypothetical protein
MSKVKSQELKFNDRPKREMPSVVHSLSVFNFPYTWKSWYGFWHNIKIIPSLIRAGWHRATKGYCKMDTWDANSSILSYLVQLLVEFRNSTICFPDSEFETFEEWIAYIDEIIDHLVYVLTDDDELSAWHDNWEKECCGKPRNIWTAKEEGIYQQYMDEVKIIAQRKKEERLKALTMLSEQMGHLWW